MKANYREEVEEIIEFLVKPSELDKSTGSGITWRKWAIDQLLSLIHQVERDTLKKAKDGKICIKCGEKLVRKIEAKLLLMKEKDMNKEPALYKACKFALSKKGREIISKRVEGDTDVTHKKEDSKCPNCNGKGYNSTVSQRMDTKEVEIIKIPCPKCKDKALKPNKEGKDVRIECKHKRLIPLKDGLRRLDCGMVGIEGRQPKEQEWEKEFFERARNNEFWEINDGSVDLFKIADYIKSLLFKQKKELEANYEALLEVKKMRIRKQKKEDYKTSLIRKKK